MTLICIWWWGFSFGDLWSVEYPFIAITFTPLRLGVVVPDKAPSMGHIDLFKNHLYSIRPCAKNKYNAKETTQKNVNMNVQ